MQPFTALEFSADSNIEVCPGNAARTPRTAYVSSRLRLCHFDIRAVKYVRYELFISLWPLIHLSLLHQVIVLQEYRVSVVLLLLTRGNWKKIHVGIKRSPPKQREIVSCSCSKMMENVEAKSYTFVCGKYSCVQEIRCAFLLPGPDRKK